MACFLHAQPALLAARSMQAALRAAGQELARGLSTGLVVWAGSSTPSCTCSCPELPRLPDCICGGSTERLWQAPCPAWSWVSVFAVLAAFCFGVAIGGYLRQVVPRQSLEEEAPSATLADEAAAQVRELQRRRGDGARALSGRAVRA